MDMRYLEPPDYLFKDDPRCPAFTGRGGVDAGPSDDDIIPWDDVVPGLGVDAEWVN